ncbi:CS025 protein, partial [Falcunculus frontatus]|nr:CS025 protein [Falcunculus frontatus]
MSSKAKRVLPTRPEPPSVEQILADVQGAPPTDPVFILPPEPPQDHGPAPGEPAVGRREGAERERLYRQVRSYVGMNQRLHGAREQLRERRRELERVGEALDRRIVEMKQKVF